jgi:hypothetical protein
MIWRLIYKIRNKLQSENPYRALPKWATKLHLSITLKYIGAEVKDGAYLSIHKELRE